MQFRSVKEGDKLSKQREQCKGPEEEGKTHRKNQRRPVCETGRSQEISEDEL